MDKNIVSFIESIEPDFSYQGTEGAMALIVENAENMMMIDGFINESEDVFVEGFTDKAKDFFVKAKKFIMESIKKAIEKIKALFMHMVNKAKLLYAAAIKKVGELLAKVSTKRTNIKVKCEWKKLKVTEFINYIQECIPTKEAVDTIKKIANTTENIDNALNQFNIPSIDDMKKEYFTSETYAEANREELKKMYDNGVMKCLNALYKEEMSACASLLKEANSIEKYNDYDAANDYESSKKLVANVNKVVHKAIASMTQIFTNVSSVSIYAFHQQLKAVIYALKKTITRGDSDEKAPEPKQLPAGKGTQESYMVIK